ncbi:unnamed protein product [Rotaria socialis]|uniref:Uncharacterized protein n=1 Tax=Rotaria socialis TaxID=392032 RepID=A0A818SBE1_9BILA|nr:unnamed protein product [Rotaria socialis]CAF4592385.1 unnamed protein product [Rotaria socialis]
MSQSPRNNSSNGGDGFECSEDRKFIVFVVSCVVLCMLFCFTFVVTCYQKQRHNRISSQQSPNIQMNNPNIDSYEPPPPPYSGHFGSRAPPSYDQLKF